jgi:basic amino acid/polyamine antiporter, APA family
MRTSRRFGALWSVASSPDDTTRSAKPVPALSLTDAIVVIVGIVVGAGIFKTPSLVAAAAGSEAAVLVLWIVGGIVTLIGALCYAELVTAYPHPGGDYHFLQRAYGKTPSFLFAWSRMTVLQTGSIALLAFVFGDYASQLFSLGSRSSAIFAAVLIVVLTAINVAGLRQGKATQKVLTTAEIAGLLLVVAAGLFFAQASPDPPRPPAEAGSSSIGLALVFILLTYGGWNEAAYISAEVRGGRRNLARALMWGIAIITAVYLLANLAYLAGLGVAGMAASQAVAADLMRLSFGEPGAVLVSVLVAVSASTSANATILTGARTTYALGRDFRIFRPLGRWRSRGHTPANALIAQGAIALALVVLGSFTRSGFATMVEYTAPVFWAFFLLTGLGLIVLRVRDSKTSRPFRVPLYPVTPLLFCASSAYMLWSSLAHTGVGALVGVAVLLAGVPVLAWARHRESSPIEMEGQTMQRNRGIRAIGLFTALALCGGLLAVGWNWLPREAGPQEAVATTSTVEKDVPYVATREDIVDEMLRMAQVTENDIVYDLGCGDGRIVTTAARQYGARGIGIDIDPVRIAESKRNAQAMGVADRVRFIEGNLFDANLSQATVVTLYLLPSVNLRLRPKLEALRPGTRIVSHNYDLGDWAPVQQKELGTHVVYLWVIPEKTTAAR